MIRAVLFDLDETLVDHSSTEQVACIHFFDRYFNGEHSLDDFLKRWKEESTRLLIENKLGYITLHQRRIQRMQSIFDSMIQRWVDEKEAIRLHQEYLELYEKHTQLFPDVIPCLNGLSDYSLGLVTNGESQPQRNKLKVSGIQHYFSSVVISEEVGVRKPDPLIFKTCLERLQVDVHEAVVVGDRLDKDIEGAIRAGIVGILIDRKQKAQNPISSQIKVIHSLVELPLVLEQLNQRAAI